MERWWTENIVDAGKFPLFMCFLAFVVTFLVTRTITRMIKAGRGPFKDQVTSSGLHIHHSIPGLILLVVGAFIAVADTTGGWVAVAAAVMIGVGTSLVLDEFALILHLSDVYWSGQGRISVDVVSLTAACLGMALLGFSPYGVAHVDAGEFTLRLSGIGWTIANTAFVLVNLLKRKVPMALFGLFIPFVALIGALRLGRPHSWWFRHLYRSERKRQRAVVRARRSARRWAPWRRWYENLLGGSFTTPPPLHPIADPAPDPDVPDDDVDPMSPVSPTHRRQTSAPAAGAPTPVPAAAPGRDESALAP